MAQTGLTYIIVKHDIFLNDINACFHSLRKAVRDLHAMSASSSHLQMGQPVVRYVWHLWWMSTRAYMPPRPDAVTVQLDPAASFGLNLDDFLCVSNISVLAMYVNAAFHQDWQDILDVQGKNRFNL